MVTSSTLIALFLCGLLGASQAAAIFSPYFRPSCTRQPTATCFFQEIGGSELSGRMDFKPVWYYGRCQTRITGEIRGMQPGAVQGIHVHMRGDVSTSDGSGVGPHFTHPFYRRTIHGLPEDINHDWGDLGNLHANANGVAKYDRIDRTVSFTSALLGRGMIIHADRDKGRPFAAQSGAAGPRRAQCVIGRT